MGSVVRRGRDAALVTVLLAGLAPGAIRANALAGTGQGTAAEQPADIAEYFFELERALENTDVVVASKKVESLADSPALVSSVSMSDLRALGARTIKDALRLMPNVVVAETTVGSTSVAIRGLSETFNQKVLFLIDGVPAWNSSHGDIPLLGIPLEAIDRIEVIRGPGSVQYGTNASAGVINVILRKASGETGLALTSSSLGQLGAEVFGSRVTEKGSVFAGASLQSMGEGYKGAYPSSVLIPPFSSGGVRADGEAFPTSGTLIKREQFANFVGGFRYKNLRVLAQGFTSVQNGLGGSPVIFQANDYVSRGALLHASYSQEIGKLTAGASLDHNISFLELDIDNFLATRDASNVVDAEPGKQQYLNPWTSNYRTRAGAWASYRLLDSTELQVMVEDEVRSAGEYAKTTWDDEVIATQSRAVGVNELSVAAQGDVSFWKLRAVVGGRFTDNSLAGWHVSPRAALLYRLGANDSLKLLYAEGFNSPVISQQDLFIRFVIEGNRALKPELVRTTEFAYTHAERRWILVASAYHLTTQDMIARVKAEGAEQPQYTNIEGVERVGAEMELQVNLAALKLLGNLSYNHSGGRIYVTDPLVHFVPRVQGNLGASYALAEHHTVGLTGRYLSRRAAVASQFVLGAQYTFDYEGVRAYLAVDNLLDTEIVNPDINQGVVPVVPGGAGRTFLAGVRYGF